MPPPLRSRSRLLFLCSAWLAISVVVPWGSFAEASSNGQTPISLERGATYRARLKLSFFQCLAGRDRIGKKLSGSGFENVRIFMSRRELPGDWPAPYRSKAGSCERYAEGVWAGPSAPRRRPGSIDAWWVTPAPLP
jgi:hypothetical protein